MQLGLFYKHLQLHHKLIHLIQNFPAQWKKKMEAAKEKTMLVDSEWEAVEVPVVEESDILLEELLITFQLYFNQVWRFDHFLDLAEVQSLNF